MGKRAVLVFIVLMGCVLPSWGSQRYKLRLYLPRNVLTEGNALKLKSIAVIRGDEDSVAKAREIPMGRAPWSGERIIIDRRTTLARLAAAGFAARDVHLTGADRVVVTRDEKAVPLERITKSAREFLEKNRPGPPGCSWKLTGKPKELFVPVGVKVSLRAELMGEPSGEFVRVRVEALSDGRKLAEAKLIYKLIYPACKGVAKKEIHSGQMITPDNTDVTFFYVESKEAMDWRSPYGKLARKTIPTGTSISKSMIGPTTPVLLVKRNQRVTMILKGVGFEIIGPGKAMSDGYTDGVIRVQNVRTGRIVRAKVRSDGTVKPMYPSE